MEAVMEDQLVWEAMAYLEAKQEIKVKSFHHQ